MNKTEVINTKVSGETYIQLHRICKRKGLTVYQMLQMMCETIIRYMSDKSNLSVELEQMMTIFEHMEGWKDAFNLCDPETQPEVVAAIYFLQDTTGKKGIRPVYVEKPYFGQWTQTVNIQDIVEQFLCTAAPAIYRRLRSTAAELGTSNALETITVMLSMYGDEASQRIYREMFADNDRGEYGQKPHEGAPYKRKHKKGVEDLDKQQDIFNDWKPFDVEP